MVNTGIVPVMLTPNIPAGQEADVLEVLSDVRIPGLIVIPGDVGFLNQFFSALLLVSNGAPEGSGLSVNALEATITLPLGNDQVAGTGDDPLVVAETESGQAFVLPVRGLGADGEPGTNDDTDRFEPGEQGQADFLLEGRGEGFHEIRFDIEGTLDGLPIGSVPITGVARGGVVVRNPFFNMTFTAPATVRKGEQFTLFTTITNISNSIANSVTVNVANQASLSGASFVSGPIEPIATLEPGDSEVLRFVFAADQTGQVSASYLDFEGTAGTGTLRFTLGVGERGVPLSPDTIVLPRSADALPAIVVDAALRVLGQAWSLATAPSGTLPEGVLRVPKQVVLDRATELAEAGFRVELGEDVAMALESVAFSWASTEDAAFEQLLRETGAGRGFFAAIGAELPSAGATIDLHRDVALSLSALPPHILVAIDDAPIAWNIRDAASRTLAPGVSGTLENAAHLPLSSGDLALLTRLGSSLYELSFEATGDGALDLAVSRTRPDGTIARFVFSGVSLLTGDRGDVTLDLLTANTPTLELDRDGDGVFEETVEASLEEFLTVPAPTLLAATAIGPETLSDADPWGRVLALLFDREMRLAEAENPALYEVEENGVRSATRQLSGRLVFLFLEAPVSDLVTRQVTASGLLDTTGQSLAATTLPVGSRLVDRGATVSGRVLNADGTPVAGAEVLYINAVPGNRIGIAQKTTGPDGTYQFDYVRKSANGPFAMRARDPATGAVQELSTHVAVDGEDLVVDLVLLGRGGVTGIVTDATGALAPNARVLVTSEVDPASFAITETDGEGRYVATNLVVGAVTVKAVLGTSSGIASGNLQRAGTFATVDVTINLTAGRVSGGVFEVDGGDVVTPIEAIEVYYLVPGPPPSELVAARSETDAFGLFAFEDVPAGDFRIVAIDRVRSRQTSKQGTLSAVGGEAVIENFEVLFFTEEVGTLTVHVQDALGEAAAGAVVTAAGRQLLTDAAGTATFENLTPGTYSVSAQEAGSPRSVSASASVVANETANVTLALPGAGRVVVTVLDTDGAPIAGQQVIRVLGGPCSGEAVLTDAAGVAVFEDVPIGNTTVKATRGSDLAAASTVVQRNGDERAVILRFAGFGTITGTVLDPNDVPAFGANVVLSAKRLVPTQCAFVKDGAAQQVSTGLDGTFTFESVPVGEFAVSASQPDFFPIPVSVSGAILADGDTRDIELKLTSNLAGELSGTVYLPDGVAPAGAGVDVTVSGGGRPDVTVRTENAGVYVFASIFPAGRYTLTASDSVTGKRARETIFLQDDQDLTVDLRLLGRAPVEVTVVDGAGDPVEDAFVELASAGFPFDRAVGSITSIDGGVVVFERISEGNFTVTANDSLGRGGRASGTVVEDGVISRVTVSLSVTGTVRGTFRTSDGSEPIPNAQVILRQGSTGRLLGATTTSSVPGSLGTFELDFVPAGSVLATATDLLTGRIGEASGTIATEGEILDLDILQLGLGAIEGSVTSGGAPVAVARVDLTSATGLSSSVANLKASATTDANGGFTFDGVPVGSFTLKATLANLTGAVTGSIDRDGQQIEDLEIALEPSGTVLGEIFRADAATVVPGAEIALRPARGILRTEAGSTGDYRIELVPAGDFSIAAEEPGGGDAGIATGTLAEGEELAVDVVFNGTGTVSGTAFESDGLSPLSSGKVRLTRPAPFPRDETVNVASDGTFQFLRIPVGDYSLSLTALSLRGTASGNISADGAEDVITIKLADSGSVFGTLVKPDGSGGTAPAANVPVTASGSFFLSTLTGASGAFRIEGIPLGDFTFRAEDPVTGGVAVVAATMTANGEELDLGTLELDVEPISVAAIAPAAGATDVVPDSAVVVTFTDPVVPASVPGRFTVRSGGANFAGSSVVSPDGLTLTFTPIPYLPSASPIDVVVSKDLKDTLGRSLGTDFASSFTTGNAVVKGLVTGVDAAGASVTLTSGAVSRSTTADATGAYRLEDVPVGGASIVATSGGLSGSIVVDVAPGIGVVTAPDIALAFVASIAGQVTTHDGVTPVGAGLEVLVSQGGPDVGLTATASDGTYFVDNIPLGAFTVDVTNPANGDRGRATGTLSTPNVTLNGVDVQMTGVGSVRVSVTDTSAADVAGVNVALSFTRSTGFTSLSGTTDADGDVVFSPVLAGPVSATADDPATGRQASGTAVAAPDVETLLGLVLEPAGAIEGTVLAPDGTTPFAGAAVKVYRQIGNVLKGEVTSAADGGFGFGSLTASESPYRIEVLVGSQRRANRRDVTVPPDGTATVSIPLVGLGAVQGTLAPPGTEELSTSTVVRLTSLAPDIGGIFTDVAIDAANGYEISGVPVGSFRLSASDTINGFLGEATGALTTDGETVTVDIDLLDNAFSFTSAQRDLRDGNDAQYKVEGNGSLSTGTDNLFGASDPGGLFLELTIENVTTRFTGASVGSKEENDRELVTSPETIGGLEVRRKIFVPGDGYFARYLEVIENTSPDALTFTAEIVTNVNSGSGAPLVVASASGELDPLAPETWVIVDDSADTDPFESLSIPSTAFVVGGSAAAAPAFVDFETGVGSSDGRLRVRYELSLASGERVALMHFVSQELSRAAAEAGGERLAALPPEALTGLEADETLSAVNFDVPADGTSAVTPLPPLNGRVSGRFLASDGVTEVGTATGVGTISAELQSSHILYQRRRDVSSFTGSFFFQANPVQGFAIPRQDFTLSSLKFFGGLSVSASASGSFTGASLVSHAPEAAITASSQISTSFAVDRAFDGNSGTYWEPSGADPAPRPFIDVVLPEAVSVSLVEVTPQTGASLDDVQIQLLDGAGVVVSDTTEPFSGADPLSVSLDVAGVERIVLSFSGMTIRVAEIEIVGNAPIEIGSALTDLAFADSASVDATVQDAGGAEVGANLVFQIGSQVLASPSNTDGRFLQAPTPVTGTDVSVTAVATAPNHDFQRAVQNVPVVSGQTSTVTVTLPAGALVRGTVTDHTGAPIGSRSVALIADSGPGAGLGVTFSDNTDAGGLYEFTGVPSGDYRLRVIESGRQILFPITVAAPTALTHDIQVPIIRDVALLVLLESSGATTPASGAQVRVKDALDSDFRFVGNTNASGQRTISDVAQGSFTVRVTHPANTSSVTDFVNAITAPGAALPMTVIVPSFGSVTGTVFYGNGTTQAGSAKVEVVGVEVPPVTTTANASGVYTLSGVRAVRPFTVIARHPDPARMHVAAQANAELSGEGGVAAVDLTLPETGTVNVTVEEEGGAEIAGADVSILDALSSDFRSEGPTDASGLATIPIVPAGSFTVRAHLAGVFIGEASGTIASHGESVSVTIARPADATVEGAVVAGDGVSPVADAPVELRSADDTTLLDSTTTDDAGSFRFAGALAAGSDGLVRAFFPDDTAIQNSTTVSATAPGQTLVSDLTLDVSVIKGRVLEFDASTPVASALVDVSSDGTTDLLPATVNPDGSFFVLNEPEGLYEIIAEDDFGLVGYAAVELLPAALVAEQDVLLPEFGAVEGFVTDAFGTPLSGASVELTNANVLQVRSAMPDANGYFYFDRVAFGSFSLTYDHPTGELVFGEPVVIPAVGAGELDATETLASVSLVVPDRGAVFGELRDSAGVVLPGGEGGRATIEGREHETSGGIYSRPTDVDSELMNFSQDGVPAGEVTVVGQDFNFGDVGLASGTLAAGGTLELNPEMGTAVSLPYEPEPAAPELHEVQPDGTLLGESDGVTGDAPYFGVLYVNQKAPPELAGAMQELSGRQLVFGPVRTSGVLHTRKVHVPAGAPYARYLEIFENPGAIPMEVSLFLEGNLWIDGAFTTSSGDAFVDPSDRYLAGENADGTAVAVVFAGQTSSLLPDFTGADSELYTQEWRRITVPAGGRAILMHFAIQAPDLATAVSRANTLVGLSSASGELSDLSSAERSDIVNYDVP